MEIVIVDEDVEDDEDDDVEDNDNVTCNVSVYILSSIWNIDIR